MKTKKKKVSLKAYLFIEKNTLVSLEILATHYRDAINRLKIMLIKEIIPNGDWQFDSCKKIYINKNYK